MNNPIIDELEKSYLGKELPAMNAGDTVKVFVKIVEGNKERIQAFEGTIIKMHGSGLNKTITVRKVFQGVGVERVFLINSPRIDKITVLRRGDVKRAKLYYLRERSGKATRIKEKIEKREDYEKDCYSARYHTFYDSVRKRKRRNERSKSSGSRL